MNGIKEAMVESGVRCPVCLRRPHDPSVLWFANEESVERCADAFHTPKREDPSWKVGEEPTMWLTVPVSVRFASGNDRLETTLAPGWCGGPVLTLIKEQHPNVELLDEEPISARKLAAEYLARAPDISTLLRASPEALAKFEADEARTLTALASLREQIDPGDWWALGIGAPDVPEAVPSAEVAGEKSRTLRPQAGAPGDREALVAGATEAHAPCIQSPFDPNPPKLETGGYGFRMCRDCSTVVDASVGHECEVPAITLASRVLTEGVRAEFAESVLCAMAFDHQPCQCWDPCVFCDAARGE